MNRVNRRLKRSVQTGARPWNGTVVWSRSPPFIKQAEPEARGGQGLVPPESLASSCQVCGHCLAPSPVGFSSSLRCRPWGERLVFAFIAFVSEKGKSFILGSVTTRSPAVQSVSGPERFLRGGFLRTREQGPAPRQRVGRPPTGARGHCFQSPRRLVRQLRLNVFLGAAGRQTVNSNCVLIAIDFNVKSNRLDRKSIPVVNRPLKGP